MSESVTLALIGGAVTIAANLLVLWKASMAGAHARHAAATAVSSAHSLGVQIEIIHKALNSQLDNFKREAAEHYQVSLEQAVNLVRITAEKIMDERLAELDKQIVILKTALDVERRRGVPEPPAVPARGIPIQRRPAKDRNVSSA